MVQDGEIYHYHLDHLGTPRELTNQQGNIVWKARYKTYGNIALKDVEEVENNLRFQGQYFDAETCLHYNRHRYYDPSVGQFTTQTRRGGLIRWGWRVRKIHGMNFRKTTKVNFQVLRMQHRHRPIGFTPISATLLPGSEFNMAYEPGQDIAWIGGFDTEDAIPNKSYVRNKLAVKEDWKEDLDRVVTFRVTKPLPVLLGPVGPQVNTKANSYLPGGGSQIAMQVNPKNRGDYLEVVSVSPLKD